MNFQLENQFSKGSRRECAGLLAENDIDNATATEDGYNHDRTILGHETRALVWLIIAQTMSGIAGQS